MNTQNAYPLSWPAAWKRTPRYQITRSRFADHSMDRATRELMNELRSLGASRLVISTNVELRQDGLPFSNRRAPTDCGAAVYFFLKNHPRVLACDRWARVEDNIYAIAKHVEALRGQERWGVGSVEQAFAGYTALPAPGDSVSATWYNVLGVPADATYEHSLEAYRREAMNCHPDKPGGSHDQMTRLNASWDQARKHFGR